jgi:hypothetical protein
MWKGFQFRGFTGYFLSRIFYIKVTWFILFVTKLLSPPPPPHVFNLRSCHLRLTLDRATLYINIIWTRHSVGRVLSFFSSRRNWTSPTPHRRRVRPLPPLGLWREGTLTIAREGWESPDSDEGTYTVVLFKYVYFVGQGEELKSGHPVQYSINGQNLSSTSDESKFVAQ